MQEPLHRPRSGPVEASGTDVAVRLGHEQVTAGDAVLRRIAEQHGYPDPYVWSGGAPAGASYFAALVLHVISQQVTTATARAAFDRVTAASDWDLSPLDLARIAPGDLRGLGLSGAKAATLLDLADRLPSGPLNLDTLASSSDEEAIAAVCVVPGIGRWTAQMFLIHQLRRPDVLPAGDLGIRHAVQQGYDWPHLPTVHEVDAFGTR
jgi:DNA-3-methyladenine glycosylase II